MYKVNPEALRTVATAGITMHMLNVHFKIMFNIYVYIYMWKWLGLRRFDSVVLSGSSRSMVQVKSFREKYILGDILGAGSSGVVFASDAVVALWFVLFGVLRFSNRSAARRSIPTLCNRKGPPGLTRRDPLRIEKWSSLWRTHCDFTRL